MTQNETRDLIAEARGRAALLREESRPDEVSPGDHVLDIDADLFEALAAALSAVVGETDGDARDELIQLALKHSPVLGLSGWVAGCRCMDRVFVRGQETWGEHVADAMLAAFPALSRDIAGEIDAEREDTDPDDFGADAFINGLLRAAEIVRGGR